MKRIFFFAFFFITFFGNAQVVGRNVCKLSLEEYHPADNDGELFFEIDCRMVDCLLELEIENDERRKKKMFQYWIYESNYYLSEDSLIMMKIDLGRMNFLMSDLKQVLMTVKIYSKSTTLVFKKLMSFDRDILVHEYYQSRKE
jgi:hypothetical protein